jgi:chromosome partitioning protein
MLSDRDFEIFLEDERLEELWPDGNHTDTVYGALQLLLEGTGDIAVPHVENVEDNLGLLVGDLQLSASEDELNSQRITSTASLGPSACFRGFIG